LGHVTRARVTQVMNLLNLAPDIQETVEAGGKLWQWAAHGRGFNE